MGASGHATQCAFVEVWADAWAREGRWREGRWALSVSACVSVRRWADMQGKRKGQHTQTRVWAHQYSVHAGGQEGQMSQACGGVGRGCHRCVIVAVVPSTSPLLPSRIEKWWMDAGNTKDERGYDGVGESGGEFKSNSYFRLLSKSLLRYKGREQHGHPLVH